MITKLPQAERVPSFIRNLSEFEIHRYHKYAQKYVVIWIEDRTRAKAKARSYLESLNLRPEEYKILKYFNQHLLRQRGFKVYD